MKKIVVGISVVVVAVSCSVGLLYNRLHNPFYTIAKLSEAVSNHDWASCLKYIDTDAMYETVNKRKDLDSFQEGFAKMLKENLKEDFSNALKAMVESTEDKGLLNDLKKADSAAVKKQVVPMGNIVAVRLWSKYGYFNIPAYMEIILRSEGFGYVVIDINDHIKYSRSWIAEDLYRQYYLAPIEEKIEQSVSIAITKRYEGCSNWIYGTCLQPLTMIERKIENKTDVDIEEIEYTLKLRGYVKYGIDKKIKAKSSFVAGKKRGWEYNQFIDEDKAWKYADLADISVDVNKIVFSDNDVVEKNENAFLLVDSLDSSKDVIAWGKKRFIISADSLENWLQEYDSIK